MGHPFTGSFNSTPVKWTDKEDWYKQRLAAHSKPVRKADKVDLTYDDDDSDEDLGEPNANSTAKDDRKSRF